MREIGDSGKRQTSRVPASSPCIHLRAPPRLSEGDGLLHHEAVRQLNPALLHHKAGVNRRHRHSGTGHRRSTCAADLASASVPRSPACHAINVSIKLCMPGNPSMLSFETGESEPSPSRADAPLLPPLSPPTGCIAMGDELLHGAERFARDTARICAFAGAHVSHRLVVMQAG